VRPKGKRQWRAEKALKKGKAQSANKGISAKAKRQGMLIEKEHSDGLACTGMDVTAGTTLDALQEYVADMERERGFADDGPVEKCLVLAEEVGEVCKSVRGFSGMKLDVTQDRYQDVSQELADVLIVLCALANRVGVSLTEAVAMKEALNRSRRWEDGVEAM